MAHIPRRPAASLLGMPFEWDLLILKRTTMKLPLLGIGPNAICVNLAPKITREPPHLGWGYLPSSCFWWGNKFASGQWLGREAEVGLLGFQDKKLSKGEESLLWGHRRQTLPGWCRSERQPKCRCKGENGHRRAAQKCPGQQRWNIDWVSINSAVLEGSVLATCRFRSDSAIEVVKVD